MMELKGKWWFVIPPHFRVLLFRQTYATYPMCLFLEMYARFGVSKLVMEMSSSNAPHEI
jgi:hypothetical protein